MKSLKTMSKKDRKEVLISVAKELQELCEFEPAIKTDGKSEKDLIVKLTEAHGVLEPEDEVSEEATGVFVFLGLVEEAEAEEEPEEEEEEAPKKKAPKKAKMEVVEDEEEEEEEEEKPKAKAPAKPKKAKDEKAAPVEKKEKVISIASFIDALVAEGGTFEELAEAVSEEFENRGKSQKGSVGSIKSHIKYRLTQDAKWLKSRKLKMTDAGIE